MRSSRLKTYYIGMVWRLSAKSAFDSILFVMIVAGFAQRLELFKDDQSKVVFNAFTMKNIKLLDWLTVGLLLLLATNAAADPISVDANNVAIDGYDTVAFHLQQSAISGEQQYATEWNGVQWWFSSAKNRQTFLSDPERYAPQYAGHCANGLSDDHKVPSDPQNFRLIDGKLYLFFSRWGQLQWAVNQQQQIELANKNWVKFQKQLGYID